jgi:hypothetical protein
VVADGPQNAGAQHLPGEAAWLVDECPGAGETRDHLYNHPLKTALRTVARTINARRASPPALHDQAHQQLKKELGFDHVKGHPRLGPQHYALMSHISLVSIQQLRLQELRCSGRA